MDPLRQQSSTGIVLKVFSASNVAADSTLMVLLKILPCSGDALLCARRTEYYGMCGILHIPVEQGEFNRSLMLRIYKIHIFSECATSQIPVSRRVALNGNQCDPSGT